MKFLIQVYLAVGTLALMFVLAPAARGQNSIAEFRAQCQKLLSQKYPYSPLILRRFLPDPPNSKIQRRIKILTSLPSAGNIRLGGFNVHDSPDPSLVMRIRYPDGKLVYRMGFTGMSYIEANDPADFYRGGQFKLKRSRGYYPNGEEMSGTIEDFSLPWDVVWYTNAEGELIAFGGAKEAPTKDTPPGADLNYTRSRWWGKVEHRATEAGYEEYIHWQAPLHDFNKKPRQNIWEGHGYGGTLLTRFDSRTGLHEPLLRPNGNFLMFYERVIEEKLVGHPRPWLTSMFAREVLPSLKEAVGPEVLVTNIISPVTGEYFKVTERSGGNVGYLAEGPNVLVELKTGAYIKAWSANEYNGRYGIFLDHLPPQADPQSMYKPVLDNNGELVDFADRLNLREIMNGSWVGRPQFEYDPSGKLWLRFHYLPLENLPAGASTEGPPTPEFVDFYKRFSAQIPVKIVFDKNGTPDVRWDLDPEFKDDLTAHLTRKN